MSSTTVDSVGAVLAQVQSGLVTSGKTNITITRSFTSGDALTSLRLSGAGLSELIAVRLDRSDTTPLTGGPQGFQSVADYVRTDFYVHYPIGQSSGYNTSSAVTEIQNTIADYKVTIKSGVWSSGNPPMPYQVSEQHPSAANFLAHGALVHRVRYVL